ncbi:hypothetical protein PIB30_031561 [Stylosanthes scabra]|uniref:Uncharacterized protein n=1 Tax=Stylosanthes scabra TaxID=79078 RepID=A0ABU6RC20_9FABA|nr:hypothetical protein [Stylosanthes scabra]
MRDSRHVLIFWGNAGIAGSAGHTGNAGNTRPKKVQPSNSEPPNSRATRMVKKKQISPITTSKEQPLTQASQTRSGVTGS